MATYDYDMVIIGGGVAGLVAASGLARLGGQVCIVEKNQDMLGGDCLYYGCVPTKTMINCARVSHGIDTSEKFGIQSSRSAVDFEQVNERIDRVIEKLGEHDSAERFRDMGVDVRFTEGRFVSDHEFELENGEVISGRRFLIATGSSPFVPPIDGLDEVNFHTNETVAEIDELPESMVVVGGGPIGLEYGQSFSRLGTDVVVVEALEEILNKEDPEIAAAARGYLEEEGMQFELNSTVEAVEPAGDRVKLRLETDHGAETVETDSLLVSVGRKPNVDGLGLEEVGVETSKRGVEVDEQMRTSRSHIYAAGDVTGLYPFTHVAEYQAGIIVGNIMAAPVPFYNRKADYSVVPWCTYTEPELARVGMTAAEAREEFGPDNVRVDKLSLADQDRPVVDGRNRGLIKLVYKKKMFGLRLVGAHILGSRAGEMIHEFVLAMKNGLGPAEISGAMHVYPTYSLSNKRATDEYFSDVLFEGWLPKLVKRYLDWTR